MKTIIKYRGGKTKEIPILEKFFPKNYGRYIEPFLGGGAMYFHLEPKQAIINDINAKLINFYLAVRDNYKVLIEELRQIEHIYTTNRSEFEKIKEHHPDERVVDDNEALYYRLRDMFNGIIAPEYSAEALYYFINKTAYSGMIRFNSKGEYNVPYGRYKNFNTALISEQHHQLLRRSEIYNRDYSEIFNMAQPNDFVFLDPPYDCVFSDYGNEQYRDGFNEDSHRRLANDFTNLGCKALMVIGSTPLTRELYGQNIVAQYSKNYSVNIRNRFQAGAIHIIVTNYGTN